MCEDCVDPMKWRIDEDGDLLVPLKEVDDLTPSVEGWEPFEEIITPSKLRNEGDPVAVTIKYFQPIRMFFVCEYREARLYAGPEEGGWGYPVREFIDNILPIIGSREWAERNCRSLNRLARNNELAPGPYEWGTSGIVFSVDRYPGEDDTSRDPRPHYC